MKPLAILPLLLLLGAGCAPVSTLPSGADVDLSGRGLTSLPAGLVDRTGITSLDISDNRMGGALPAEIRRWSALRTLDASGNRFTGIPAEIGQLQQLETLDFSDNDLTGLPLEIGNLKALRMLDLSGNDVSLRDLETIRRALPDLTVITDDGVWKGDLIRVAAPLPDAVVRSPLGIQGEARGVWFFEASFPVRIVDANDVELGVVPAQAIGEWMTEDFVPFSATLPFATPTTPTGTLVLQKDNPSGLPEFDDELRIPVRFAP